MVTVDQQRLSASVASLNESLREYMRLSGKSVEDTLLKQGAKLAFALSGRLRLLTPAKGKVREERLRALAEGGGIRVRESVRKSILFKYAARQRLEDRKTVFGRGKKDRASLSRKGKRVNLQALMVQAELNVREKGRGYLGFAARFSGLGGIKGGLRKSYLDRVRRVIAEAGLTIGSPTSDELRLRFPKDDIAGALQKPKQADAIRGAIAEVNADIRTYLERKMAEAQRKARLA